MAAKWLPVSLYAQAPWRICDYTPYEEASFPVRRGWIDEPLLFSEHTVEQTAGPAFLWCLRSGRVSMVMARIIPPLHLAGPLQR